MPQHIDPNLTPSEESHLRRFLTEELPPASQIEQDYTDGLLTEEESLRIEAGRQVWQTVEVAG